VIHPPSLMRFNSSLTCCRHGYPILSLDFQRVLQVLYDNIQDKSKILTKKEIWNVDVTHNGVVVKTSDGSLYNGDILVGADGNQSTVRDTMWQIADELSPGWISSDEHGRRFRKLPLFKSAI
jgi:2-polyprenyl-6-methoxyphenol hydroxylase-like FAD-dependent oxidoreductase